MAHVTEDHPVAALPQGLANQKILAATAFERTRMPMVIADARQPDQPVVLVNQAFLNLTGYTADEVLGRNCRFLQGEATSPAAIAEIRSRLHKGQEVNVELLNYRKDGSHFWNQLLVSPIHDDEGEIAYFFASQVDVTSYRKIEALEASEHRLLMEVDHRTRNALAIVESIVRLSRADNPERYAASIQHRVQALSRAHALLAACNWQAVSLREVVRQQIQQFETRRIALDGNPMLVLPTNVQAISLTIHELIMNAATHGALSSVSGRIDINWDEGPEGLEISWMEKGGPTSLTNRHDGFGHVIISAMIEKQLRGQVRRYWEPAGLRLELIIPRD